MILIIVTFHKKQDAVGIGKGLLKERLIACYNLIPVESAYWWRGKLLEEDEVLMILKTRDRNFKKIEDYIKKNSGYEVPEVISIKPIKVNNSYLKWVHKETEANSV